MKRRSFIVLFLIFLVHRPALVLAQELDKQLEAADESNFQYQTVQTPEGLVFQVPEDMPIEKKNGLQSPMPFDEYMYGKFKQMDRRLTGIDQKLDRIEKLLSTEKEPKPAVKSEEPGILISK